jgi:hypothetical protein
VANASFWSLGSKTDRIQNCQMFLLTLAAIDLTSCCVHCVSCMSGSRNTSAGIVRLKRDGTRAETRFLLSPKRTIPFKSAGASVQSTAGSRDVRIGGSNARHTTLRGDVSVLTTHSIRQFPSRASPCAIRFQTHSTVNRLRLSL